MKRIYRLPYLLSSSYIMITCTLVKLPLLTKFTFQASQYSYSDNNDPEMRGHVPLVNSHSIDGTYATKEKGC